MIRPIDIRLNAAHPELPLAEAVTFTGSPSTVLIRGVPPNCGRWAITAVFVAVTYPDGSTTTRAAVQSANGVWVATLPGTATSGRTTDGFRVIADGIDENGEAATGYILAVADFAVATLDVTPAPQPGETSWQMLYFDAVPGTLRKGDVAKVDGVLKLYNGTAWEPFAAPVTFDNAVTPTSANGVRSSGIWSAIWGTASTAFSSLYDWVVDQLAGKQPRLTPAGVTVLGGIKTVWAEVKRQGSTVLLRLPTELITINGKALSSDVTLTGADIPVDATVGAQKINAALAGKASKSDVDPLLFARYYPDGSVKSAAEFTSGIKYDDPDTTNRTITVKSFCNTGDSANDNSGLVGRVVIPPFVDAQGNPYISDDGTRFKVVGVAGGGIGDPNTNLTAIVAPTTVARIKYNAFFKCTSLTTASLPSVTDIGDVAFFECTSLTSVDFGGAPRPDVPSLGGLAFDSIPTACRMVVPYTQYDAWIAADGWKDLPQEFVRHAEKADKPATFTTGNLAALDAQGNPTDSQIPKTDVAVKGEIPYNRITITTGQLQDHAVQKVRLNAATTTLTLPALTDLSGKVSDFGIDMVNGHAPSGTPTAASFQLDGTLGADYNLIVPKGETWSDMTALAPNEMAVYYFTLSAFAINDKPTWEVMKKVVTLVPVPSAP